MTGAELLALARHNRSAGETDADTAQHLATAMLLIWRHLTAEQRRHVLWQLMDRERVTNS